jgi:2-polyprenyl-6-methoxyphenol hydroxylase-like FAD-dependent oxidoreductase
VPAAVNIRRELLDPIVREAAANAPGVDLLMGRTVTGLLRDGEGFAGVEAQDVNRDVVRIPARLVVGADGRDSKVARLAAVSAKVTPHARFSYAAYFEGPSPEGAPDGTVWFLDPHWGAAFPTDGGLTMYACMPTKDRLPEFRRDLDGALRAFIASLPEPPPILEARQVGAVLGKIEMPNVQRAPIAPGLALVGDAALATDPLFGVGCGWAFQSSEWLVDAVAPALRGEEQLSAGLKRYRARHRRGLNGHAFLIHDYATGRPFSPVERILYPGAVYDPRVARIFHAFGTRNIGPARMMATAMPLAVAANVRRALSARAAGRGGADAGAAASTGVPAGEGVAEAVQ